MFHSEAVKTYEKVMALKTGHLAAFTREVCLYWHHRLDMVCHRARRFTTHLSAAFACWSRGVGLVAATQATSHFVA
jgi:geranylgeranyl pyrophosphate synthase